MSLGAHQAKVLEHLLRVPRDSARDASLHPRWDLYRDMVRARLLDLARGAYPRTRRTVGDAVFDEVFEEALSTAPPTTPYIWRVASGLGPSLEEALARRGVEPFVLELLRLERARWTVKHEPVGSLPELRDFVFEAVPVIEPTVRVLEVAHSVEEEFETRPPARRATLAVHAKRSTGEVSVFVLNESGAALLAAFVEGEGTAAERALAVARARGSRIDEGWLESLGTLLAGLVEAEILLGSRA